MFYGIKSSAFLLHETKPGVLAPATRLPAHTPSFFFFFFLHNSLRSSERQLTLLIIVILEGMEKVASQLPVVSWSARGIANATYVVWRIFWKSIYVS